VAEVFLALLKLDEDSIVKAPEWRPMHTPFGLADILKFALKA